MVNRNENTEPAKKPKRLSGVGIVISQEKEDGSVSTLGICFSRNTDDLKELIKTLATSGEIKVNLAQVRAGSIKLDHGQ